MVRLQFKYLKYRLVEMRDGCVYKTKKVGEQWFSTAGYKTPSECPETNIWDDNNECWVPTMEQRIIHGN